MNRGADAVVREVDIDDPRVRSEVALASVERAIGWARLVVMASGTLLFPLLADRPGTNPVLGYTLLGLGWAYSLVVIVFRLPRRFPILGSVWLTTPSDIVMTLLWIAATGGVESPWLAALYVAFGVASLRARPRDVVALALLAGVGYVAMVASLSQLAGREPDVAIRVLYLVLLAGVCGLVARERLNQLVSRLQLLDLTQEVGQVGSWEWTIADGELVWSRELHRMFGLAPDEQPTLEGYRAAIHPDDLERHDETMREVLAARGTFRLDHRIVTPDGAIRWLHCRGRVIVGKDGAPRRLVGSAQDVTDARELQEQLLVARKLASMGTLASGIAHEINNPLAYVANSLTLARKNLGADPAAVREALDAAQDGCRRVVEIVRGLKTFSRSDDEPRRAVDLAATADTALAMAAHEIGAETRVKREYGPAPAVMGSESRLLQLVLNLVVNAAQARKEGAARHEIRVSVRAAEDGRVLLEVSDDGCGIADEHLPKIFDPFFTTKPPGVGTGLGLSFCHGIVRDLGGEIAVETQLGRGTTLRVLLPAAEEAAPEPPAARTEPDAAAPASLRVLVVDDEVHYASSLRMLLAPEHDVAVAHDGARALELLSTGEPYDVVLCDLMMAGMSGMDLYEALAQSRPAMVPRVVFLTGGATTSHAREFLKRDDVRHLEKPVDLPLLEQTIRDVTRAARAGA